VSTVLFSPRVERVAGGAESFSPEYLGGNQLCSEVQFFYHCREWAVVPKEPTWWPHLSVFPDSRDKADWKVKVNKF
jgi:hypothetical protein